MKKLFSILFVFLIFSTKVWADLTATEGLGIDLSSAGAGTDFTIAFDPTELLGSRTWGDASTDTIVWTWNRATGTDPTMTFNSGSIGLQALTLTTDLAATEGGTGASNLNAFLLKATYDVAVDGFVDGNNTAYAASWNGNINAPSMDAVYDKIQALPGGHDAATVVDSQSINLTLSTQQITADVNDKDYGDVVVSGTGAIWAVDDDSHAHTTTTISGVDISSDTNLSGDTEIVLTGDALSIGAAITRDVEVPGLETNAAVDSEAELEAILGIGFGASKVGTSGYILVADGTDFESVPMSGDVTIATGGATVVADESHAHTTTTISGLDISGDTNLAVGALLTLTNDTLDANSAAVANGDTKHVATGDQIYDFVIALGYLASTAIDTFAELDAIVADKALVNKADGAVWLGVHDFGGATSVEIPHTAAPTVDAEAEMAWETDDNDLHIYDGYRDVVIASKNQSRSFVILTPAATHDFPLWQTPRAITITSISAICIAGTNVIGQLQEYAGDGTTPADVDSSDWTVTTAEYNDTALTNGTIDAGDWLGWKTASVSGSVTSFSITFEYYEQ